MEKELTFAFISSVIYLIGAVPYWIDVLKGRTMPHLFTFIVWFILTCFNVYVLLSHAEYYAVIPGIIMSFSLFFFGIIFGIKNLKNIFDWLCLFFALGLIL